MHHTAAARLSIVALALATLAACTSATAPESTRAPSGHGGSFDMAADSAAGRGGNLMGAGH
jgi:hypothetical protein